MSDGVRGRPRSAAAKAAALASTAGLLREVGYDELTMVGVAARAGIGKQTLYRWWPSKASLVTECVLAGVFPVGIAAPSATGDPERDLRRWWLASREMLLRGRQREIYRALLSAAAADDAASSRLAAHLSAPLESAIARVLRRGVEAGAIRAGVPEETVARLLLGALIYDVFSPAAADGDASIDLLLRGIQITSPPPAP